jgi:dTDP-4-amino-4,6-dideoxy-D-glucose acyltransferase
MSWLSKLELAEMDFASIGDEVYISKKASIYGAERIHLGNRVRIDDYCVISAGCDGISIGSNVHIAVYVSIIGAGHIFIGDFVGISSRTSIYSSNDDYSGAFLTGPTVAPQFSNVTSAPVALGRHSIIGSGSVILPGVVIEECCAIGALSLVRRSCERFGIFAGNPLRKIGERKADLLQLEKQYIESISGIGQK